MSDIFVSYASEDRERVKSLVEALLTEGWSIWWDRQLIAGPRFDQEIETALNDARCVVVVWSEHSVSSRWCRDEASEGLERDVLVPVRIDDVRPPIGFRSAQTASLLDWPDSRGELNSLLFGIRRHLGVPSGDPGAPERTPHHSVAVLPFERDTDSEEAFFSEGLAEDLIDRLAATELKVIARTSSFQLNDESRSFQEIGRRLGVSHLVTGRVRRAGETVRVNIRLINAGDGTHEWADHYDRRFADVFKLQDDIAEEVTTELRRVFGGRNQATPPKPADDAYRRGLAQRGTDDLDAFEDLLKGQQRQHDRTTDGLVAAKAHFEEAITKDPKYARAWAGLANCEATLAIWGVANRALGMANAKVAATTAIGYDSTLASPYLTLAEIQSRYEWSFAEAEESIRTAVELAPGSADVAAGYGSLLNKLGRPQEGAHLLQQAWDRDPLNQSVAASLAVRCIRAGLFDEARDAIDCLLELSPAHGDRHWLRAQLCLDQGDFERALDYISAEDLEHLRLSVQAIALHHLGREQESDAILTELVAADADGAAFQIAEVHAQRNEELKAVEWLDHAYNKRDPGLAELLSSSSFRSLYRRPSFREFARRLSLEVPIPPKG